MLFFNITLTSRPVSVEWQTRMVSPLLLDSISASIGMSMPGYWKGECYCELNFRFRRSNVVEYGVDGPSLGASKFLYSVRYVYITASKSNWFPVMVGLHQGCPLSLILFTIPLKLRPWSSASKGYIAHSRSERSYSPKWEAVCLCQSKFEPSPMVMSFGQWPKGQDCEYKQLKWVSFWAWLNSALETGWGAQSSEGGSK